MKKATWIGGFGLALSFMLVPTHAEAGQGGLAIGLNFGFPGYYRPWYGYCGYPYGYPYPYGYYQPYPIYVTPPPVYVASPPVVQAAPAPGVAPAAAPANPVYRTAQATQPAQTDPASDGRQTESARLLRQLSNVDENARSEAVLQLGRMRATNALDPVAARLAGDKSPAVRDAAARALGLMASTKALPALERAARLDADRDVRRSAQFSIEVIQTNR
ncbi:MAG: HEAT repeat domain-containing protein [Gemmataceae bacterium]